MIAVRQQVTAWRAGGMLGQLMRFGITGVAVTALCAAIYWPIATYGHHLLWLGSGAPWPIVGQTVAFAVGVAIGTVAHSRFSFRGHGRRDNRTAHRFFVVQLFGFGLNQAFTWLLTGPLLHGPTWWPLVPMVFVVPLVTFGLQRQWVFA